MMPKGPVVDSRVSKRRRVVNTSRGRKEDLRKTLVATNSEMPFPCTTCRRLGRKCAVGKESKYCAECVAKGRSDCDVGFSPEQWRRLVIAREKIQKELDEVEEAEVEILMRKRRLRKQFSSVDARQKEMYEKELALIANLEKLEGVEAEKSASPIVESSNSGTEKSVAVSDAAAQTEDSGAISWQDGANPVVEWNPGAMVGRSEVSEETMAPFSPGERFPESRLASEEIAAFDDFAAKMFPLPGLLDSDVVS